MVQKILKVGSSAAVTISKKSLEELGLKIGDQVAVRVDRKARRVTVEPPTVVDKELIDWTKGFITQYRNALESLAKK